MGAPPSDAGGPTPRSGGWRPVHDVGLPAWNLARPRGPWREYHLLHLAGVGLLSPILLTALVLNLYLCIGVRFFTFTFLALPSSVMATGVQEPLPVVVSRHSTTYFLMGFRRRPRAGPVHDAVVLETSVTRQDLGRWFVHDVHVDHFSQDLGRSS